MPLPSILFYVFAAVLLFAALRVITAKNPVHAALYLVLSFFTASMLWMLLKAEFLSIVLVLVYVGAVMVLFLFVVMMLDLDLDKLREGFAQYLPMGLTIGVVMAIQMAMIIIVRSEFATKVSPAAATKTDNTRELGRIMYTEYTFALEIAAIVLLVAIVAAIALTLRQRKDVRSQSVSEQVAVKASDRLRIVKMQAFKEQAPDEAAGSDTTTKKEG